MTIDADRLANLRSRIERAEDAVANLDGSGLWAERYAGDVAFLLGALAATGPARRLESAAAILRDVAEVAACSETEGGPDGCEGCRARSWLEGATTGPGSGALPPASKMADMRLELEWDVHRCCSDCRIERGDNPPHKGSCKLGPMLVWIKAARTAPQTDHRAPPAPDPYAPDTYRVKPPATPPSGSPPESPDGSRGTR